jgi:hypothetical protein
VRGDGHAGSVTGFALAVFAFFVAMVGTTLPTPLYPLFEQRYSFGPLLVTVIFAIYAFGVIAGLILFGNLSDRLGRKPPLELGLVLSAASAILFLLAGSLVPIYVGRVVSALGRHLHRDGDRLRDRPRPGRPAPARELRGRVSRTSAGSARGRSCPACSGSGPRPRCGRRLRSISASSSSQPEACCSRRRA